MTDSIKLSTTQFGRAINRNASYVEVNIKRGKLVKQDGKINLSEPKNAMWIEKWKSKGNHFDITAINKPAASNKQPEKISQKTNPAINTVDIDGIDLQRKKAELKKLNEQTRNEKIKADKHEQRLIAKDDLTELFEYSARVYFENYQKNIDSIINKLSEYMDGTPDNLKEEINTTLQKIYNETRKELIEGVENISNEYSEVRGKGEKK